MTKNDKQQNQAEAQQQENAHKRSFKGIVVSDKMDKTVVVKVDNIRQHPKYKKRYYVSRKFSVHDEKNQYKENEEVEFIECRPLSKKKRWRVVYNK